MRIVHERDVPLEDFTGGSTYRTLVGDGEGSTPVRFGLQVSPPGYATPDHSHPYLEIITVLEGTAEGWCEDRDGTIALEPGITLVIPASERHGFRVIGDGPFKTYGIHVSPHRIVDRSDDR